MMLASGIRRLRTVADKSLDSAALRDWVTRSCQCPTSKYDGSAALRTTPAGSFQAAYSDSASRMQAAVLLVIVVSLNGCATLSGEVLRSSREEFNEIAQISNAEQHLLNIVRLRYGSSPYFLEMTTVSTSASMAGALGVSGSTAPAAVGLNPNVVIIPSISVSQTPSFVFQPLAGEKLGRQLLRPVDLRTIALLRTAGWGLREILVVLVDNINGIPNAPALTQFAPTASSDNDGFKRVAALFEQLQEKGLLELGVDSPATPAAPGSDAAGRSRARAVVVAGPGQP